VTGDWNKDGTTDVGVFRPSSGNWYLETTQTGEVNKAFHFGTNGDNPVTGDWNKDGTSDVGVFRPSSGNWYLETTQTGEVNRAFHLGTMGDLPKALQLPPIAPVAAFTSDIQAGHAPLTVRFTNQSTGTTPLTYAWDFNDDGKADSTEPSPSYTYTVPGVYTVNLTVSNSGGRDSEIKNGYITVTPAPVAPVAAFTSDIQAGDAPLTVRFTNQSTGTAPLTLAWDFNNDGMDDSSTRDPTFTYSTPGIYSVKLTVTNIAGSDPEIKYGYIAVYDVPAPPVADFISDKHYGNAPLVVRFFDSSTGTAPFTYAWDFNDDGHTDSNDSSPTFIYQNPGNYTVNLTVTNFLGSDVKIKTGFITVTEGQPGGPHAGIALTFDDTSIDQWYAIRGMLQQYNAHVTFFVSQYQNLEPYQIDELKALQADGHEIGFHGVNHVEADTYLSQNHTVQEYIDNEVIPGINLMRADGFNTVDFALPGGSGSENIELTNSLQQYFTHIRGINHGSIYYEYGSNTPVIFAQGIDNLSYGQSMDDIYNYISTAKQQDAIVIFYAHVPVQTATADYMLSYDRLENILINGTENNMKFYTVSELT
jgi:PKD repeat protein